MRIQTLQGKQIDILHISDLGAYRVSGEHIRSVCPVHGGDHQHSLSIDPKSGWGHCFNAACNATVLVRDFNPEVAEQLLRQPRDTPSPPNPPPTKPIPAHRTKITRSLPLWQQEERATLLRSYDWFRRALIGTDSTASRQPQAYLEARALPLEIAHREQVASVPADLLEHPLRHDPLMERWRERLLFPLTSPSGHGFVGRTLWHWHTGMDEATHKAMLETTPGAPLRWLKTNPAGWFCPDFTELRRRVILVEGPFDRLALLAAGFSPTEVIALVGTSAPLNWFPRHIRQIILALDGDEAGMAAMMALIDTLQTHYDVSVCPAPDDAGGKDWSERWRRHGAAGLAPLAHLCDRIR